MKIPFDMINMHDIFGAASVDSNVFPSSPEYRRYLSQVHEISSIHDQSNNLVIDFNNDDLTKGRIFEILSIVLPNFDYSRLIYMGTRYSCGTLNASMLKILLNEVKRFEIPTDKFRVFNKFDVWFVYIDWDPFWVNRKLSLSDGKIDSRTWITT